MRKKPRKTSRPLIIKRDLRYRTKNGKQTSEDQLHRESTVSCLFAIYNLWPLQLDCVCVCVCCEHVGGWGCLAHGSASKGLLVETWHRHLTPLFRKSKSPSDTSYLSVEFPPFTDLKAM